MKMKKALAVVMKALAVVMMAVAILMATVCGREAQIRYEEAGVSYTPPKGWVSAPFPGLRYPIVYGPETAGGFTANLVIVDEVWAGPLAEYAEENIRALDMAVPDFAVLDRGEFETRAGAPVIWVVTENTQMGHHLRQTFFFLGQGSQKYVMTGSTAAWDGAALDGVFAESAKTVQIH